MLAVGTILIYLLTFFNLTNSTVFDQIVARNVESRGINLAGPTFGRENYSDELIRTHKCAYLYIIINPFSTRSKHEYIRAAISYTSAKSIVYEPKERIMYNCYRRIPKI